MWAVHASNILPKDTLEPIIGNFITKEAIPGISNTIHFSLGELVRPHSGTSWEDRPFAIITPLSSIIDQAVNIFAHDTFITGKWKLRKETIVLVPEGTDISEIKDREFSVVSYKSSEKKLRASIDEIIQNQKGLHFRMEDNTVLLGSHALIDGSININTASFFESLLKEKQGRLSFGDHIHSQIGDAAVLGLIARLSVSLIHVANHPALKVFYKPSIYVNYHIVKSFYHEIKDKYFTQEEQNNIEEMLSTQEKKVPDLKNISDPLWPFLSPEYFQNMSYVKLLAFKSNHADLFKDCQQNEFIAAWAIARWFSIGYKAGLKENLPEIINKEIGLFTKEKLQDFYPLFSCAIFELLIKHNNKHSDRLEIIRSILSSDTFKTYRDELKSCNPELEIRKEIQQELLNFNIAQ